MVRRIRLALKGTIMWDTSPVQASLHKRLGDESGPACYSAHQAPPREAHSHILLSRQDSSLAPAWSLMLPLVTGETGALEQEVWLDMAKAAVLHGGQ